MSIARTARHVLTLSILNLVSVRFAFHQALPMRIAPNVRCNTYVPLVSTAMRRLVHLVATNPTIAVTVTLVG
jgi:hypothetical protein